MSWNNFRLPSSASLQSRKKKENVSLYFKPKKPTLRLRLRLRKLRFTSKYGHHCLSMNTFLETFQSNVLPIWLCFDSLWRGPSKLHRLTSKDRILTAHHPTYSPLLSNGCYLNINKFITKGESNISIIVVSCIHKINSKNNFVYYDLIIRHRQTKTWLIEWTKSGHFKITTGVLQ
jgi:hypothetical protein